MCNQPPATKRDFSDPSDRQAMAVGQAGDEPATASNPPERTFGQLPGIHVSDEFDEPLPDAEIAFWEADSTDRLDSNERELEGLSRVRHRQYVTVTKCVCSRGGLGNWPKVSVLPDSARSRLRYERGSVTRRTTW